MAGVNPSLPNAAVKKATATPAAGPRLALRRAEPQEREAALAVLLLGKPRGGDPAVEQFLRFTREHRMGLEELWAAYPAHSAAHAAAPEPIAAALLVPSPGRVAMVFLSPSHDRAAADAVVQLLDAACARQDPRGLRLAQAILDPDQETERLLLLAARFRELATLVYMQRATRGSERDALASLDPAIRVEPWSDAARPRFEAAILASYEGTLDCPGLVGLRGIGDVLAGHMASGRFDPRLWHVLSRGDEPVAVLLVSPVPPRRAAELVYLGLSPAWRGKGIGRRLVEHALRSAHAQGASSLMLAVDDHNTPAVRLYGSLGFIGYAKKLALIRGLGE